MEPQAKSCQSCKKDFTIETEDFNFYEKMKVPAPTWCPECRMIRRFSFMNIRSLYKRICVLCGQNVISMYSSDKKVVMYCDPCWWGDTWDGTEYGVEYDPERNFFEQLKELRDRTPFMALECLYASNINSPYTNYTAYQKNSYLCYFGDYTENCMYSSVLAKIRDCVDCYSIDESELVYEGVGAHKLYNCYFTIDCGDCHDVHFSRNCYDCSNCFGCVNLRNKSYCIWNEQYSKEEYQKKMAEINLASFAMVEKMRKDFKEFSMKFPRRFYQGDSRNKNVSGEYVYQSKNAKDIYKGVAVEDSKHVQFVTLPKTKDAYDYTGWGYDSEKLYECCLVGEGAYNCLFSNECWPNAMNLEYCMYTASGSKDCFGCVNIKKKQYCILNKQYSKEDYEKLKRQIIADMDKNPYIDEKGRVYKYGEFLPVMMSPFAYNETIAGEYFPIRKEGALEQGYTWLEMEKPLYKITKKFHDLPDVLSDTNESIINEVIECMTCNRGFKIIQNEYLFLTKVNIALPRSCPECRHKVRVSETNMPHLYDRNCMKCNVNIKTAYAPENPEIVYCVSCYQALFA